MGLPPTISLLTDTSPILRKDKFPAEDFCAGEEASEFTAERVLADTATIDVARDLFKNCRRVNLSDILVSLVIKLCSPKHPGRSTRRKTYRLGVEHALFGPKLELFGRVPSVAIMEMGGKTLRSGEKIHI